MATLSIKDERIAVVEYPPVDNPKDLSYDLKEDGRLFVFGYLHKLMGKDIRGAQCFNFIDLKGYTILGQYHKVSKAVKKDVQDILHKTGANPDNCVVLIKNILNVT